MDKYDPANPIGSEEWLALDEAKQIELVRDFHAELDLEMPVDALSIHLSIHVIVENQLAMGVELIPETIAKLTRQGLNRHEAIHVIGAILSEDIFDLVKGNIEEFSPTKYRRRLEKITAKRWLKGKY
ncbi:hypothetical protein [Paraglaciecola sp. MB-3u-78]|jgi:hypothetical protein|uniref:hypothetical protein n=1 Tax=Paraglaciecola sp. MB-3u-78 TaxID=2058332 RepID=UPI000C3209BF|nr:hypothetical protein [Paraglaciecola sp. MB-3u-78]PKG96173.1 hypothetical protein CXF95_24820 [Paraglaciecola sp. MB-3u-78]